MVYNAPAADFYSFSLKLAYPLTAKAIVRCMSTQFSNKDPGHQRNIKKGDTNRKKGDDPKPEDKDNNATGTVGAHVGDITTPEDSIAPSGGSSIGVHVLEVTKQPSRPTQSVEDLSKAYSIDDAIWGGTSTCDVSVDIANSKEVMAGSHITEEHIFIFRRSDQHELLNVTAHEPRKDDSFRDYDLYFLNNYHNWNKPPNVTDTKNSGMNIVGANFVNKEHQNYYNRQKQQYITPKYNSGLEQATFELAPNIILQAAL